MANSWKAVAFELAENERVLAAHLRNAIAFITNTAAFGKQAETGILCAGKAKFDIDAAKKALRSIKNG